MSSAEKFPTMPNERKHVKSIEGHPRPSDIFKPHLMGVELFDDMDEFFREARRAASGEDDDEITRSWKEFEGQRAVAIITPGRLMMFSPCADYAADSSGAARSNDD